MKVQGMVSRVATERDALAAMAETFARNVLQQSRRSAKVRLMQPTPRAVPCFVNTYLLACICCRNLK